MIRLITPDMEKEVFTNLSYADIYEAKINVLFITYGLSCNFCSFYEAVNEKNERVLLMSQLGRDYVIKQYSEDFDEEELAAFLRMNRAFGVFLPPSVLKKIERFVTCEYLYNNLMEYLGERYFPSSGLMEANPSLDDAYEILRHDFKLHRDIWLTDLSHRIRHGISRLFIYGGACTATVLYDKGDVFITQVATKEAARGKGLATSLLREIASLTEYRDKRVLLVCRNTKLDFYTKVGFKRVGDAAQIYGLTSD